MEIVIEKKESITKPSKRIAIFVSNLNGWRGKAALYLLCPSLDNTTHVIVSSVDSSDLGPETMVFPSNAQGECDFMEIWTKRPSTSHKSALFALGYELI